MSNSTIRVRMAPSPTGFFHVGSARTALFNYLFARHHGGAFILRIEDTDAQRSLPEYEEIIYQGMNWLGLTSDENPQDGGAYGPYRQSERFDIYRQFAAQLVKDGLAYPAYETPEELAAMKETQRAQKLPPRYNGAHRHLTAEERAAFEEEGRTPVIRFAVPDGATSWVDLVRGEVTWQNSEIDDFVIQKSDGNPTYNFACAVDDALMEISHVIRGEDGLSNTPRQIMLYHALGKPVPQFAHLPFLLGTDRSKLSKRHGAVNLMDFADAGILPEAMLNYLALLGWNPGEGETQEIFSRDELIQHFSLEHVGKAGAIFDQEKLEWFNIQHFKQMPIEEFAQRAASYLENVHTEMAADAAYTSAALDMARQRIYHLSDITSAATYFFSDNFELDPKGKKHDTPEAKVLLAKLHERLKNIAAWNHDNIETAIRDLADEENIKAAAIIHPTRYVVSGRTVGPSLFELLELLGQERVLRRLSK